MQGPSGLRGTTAPPSFLSAPEILCPCHSRCCKAQGPRIELWETPLGAGVTVFLVCQIIILVLNSEGMSGRCFSKVTNLKAWLLENAMEAYNEKTIIS